MNAQFFINMDVYQVYALYLSLGLFFYILLTALVIRERYRKKVGIGHGEDAYLARLVRVHGNFIEVAPLFYIGYLGLAIFDATPFFMHVLGLLFALSRALHAYGLSRSSGASAPRLYGMAGTLTAMGIMAISLIILAFTRTV
jgi:uncharacterized protein